MFVEGPEFFFVLAQLDPEGNMMAKLKKNIRPVILEEMQQQEMFTDRQLDGQTDTGKFPGHKKSSSGLRPEELMNIKRALKRALKFR